MEDMLHIAYAVLEPIGAVFIALVAVLAALAVMYGLMGALARVGRSIRRHRGSK